MIGRTQLRRAHLARSQRPCVVVTGLGLVTPLGRDVWTTWRALLRGSSGVRRIQLFDATTYATRIAAEVHPFTARSRWRPSHLESPERKVLFLLDALDEALTASGIKPCDDVLARAAVVVGAECGRPDLDAVARCIRQRQTWRPPYLRTVPHLCASVVAERIATRGPVASISLACSSSAAAVAHAVDWIRDGVAEMAVVGGADSQIDPLGISTFSLLGVLSRRNHAPRRASRPFDAGRDGFVMGEGAGVVVLESGDLAKRRGAPILAELAGYGISANASSVTDSPTDGRGAADAMEAALEDSALTARAVDYVNAHGTGTIDNDLSEARAIRRVFARRRGGTVAVSSTKASMGHLIAAAGVVELALSVLALSRGVAPPTTNLEQPDPGCELDHVACVPRRLSIRNAVSNSFGFGGTNVALVVSGVAA